MPDSQLTSDQKSLQSPWPESPGQPKHEQLRDYLVSQIESGQLGAGEALPSEHRLAESLGIARSTVRQALATLERAGVVRRIHGKGTYIHEQARQRLKKGQDLFALIVPETAAGFYPSLQVSFEGSASTRHTQVIVCNSNNEIDKQGNSILQLMDLHVAGVAIVPTTYPETPTFHIRQLHERGIPVVCCSRPVPNIQTPLLAIPFEKAGELAGELIRQKGHQQVAFFCGFESAAGRSYEAGFRKGLGARIQPEVYFGTTTTPEVGLQEKQVEAELHRLLSKETPPTAIFATFDSYCEQIYLLLNRMGLRIPEDISLVSLGGTRRQGALANRLTAITVDEIRMGSDAIELLEQMRVGKIALDANETRMMPLGIHAGQTLAEPTPRARAVTQQRSD